MKKITAWLTKLFISIIGGYEWLRPRAIAAVKVVNGLKENISNFGGAIVAITPTKSDDEFLVKAKKAMEKVVTEMAAVEGIISGNESFEDAFEAFINYLQSKSEKARVKFWIELAGKVVQSLSDGQVSIGEAVAIAQIIYSEFKK